MTYSARYNRILQALEDFEVEYLLVGGYAVIIYGLMRLTSDLDIVIKPTEDNIAKLQHALLSVYPGEDSIREITLIDLTTYPVIRYGTPDNFYIDVIVAIGSAFHYGNLEIVEEEFAGHKVHMASVKSLFEMKKDILRPRDRDDAMFLFDKMQRKD